MIDLIIENEFDLIKDAKMLRSPEVKQKVELPQEEKVQMLYEKHKTD